MADLLSEAASKSPEQFRNLLFDIGASAYSVRVEGSNPYAPNSMVGALLAANATLGADIVETLPELLELMLGRFASYTGTPEPLPSPATGAVIFNGEESAIVPSESFISVNQSLYTSINDTPVLQILNDIVLLQNDGVNGRVVFKANHNLASSLSFEIIDVQNPYEYFNGIYTCIVVSDKELAFKITTPTIPIGIVLEDGKGSWLVANVSIVADKAGSDSNADPQTPALLTTPIPGIVNAGGVSSEGITGGGDGGASSDQLVASFYQKTSTGFNEGSVTVNLESQLGFIETLYILQAVPYAGQAVIVFTTTGDIIPNQSQIDLVQDANLPILPSTTSSANILYPTPEFIYADMGIINLQPDTPSMRNAVISSFDTYLKSVQPYGSVSLTDMGTVLSTVSDVNGNNVTRGFMDPVNTNLPISLDYYQLVRLGTLTFSTE